MLAGPVSHAAPPRRRLRMFSAGASLLAAFAFLTASLAVLVAGAHSASAASSRSASHTVGTNELAGNQPNHVRATPADRSDTPQHRAVPWTPVANAPDVAGLAGPGEAVVHGVDTVVSWHPYDSTPAQGRAPPR